MPEDLTPYTLDEALALFRIEGPVDESVDADAWLALAVQDSLRGNDVAGVDPRNERQSLPGDDQA